MNKNREHGPSHWLVKCDPAEYSAKDLERDERTIWDGVQNPLALQHLRAMKVDDPVFVYHTGEETAIVALGRVASPPRKDGNDVSGKSMVIELAFDRWLKRPVSLAAIKAEPFFANFDLVRMSRLSIMPVGTAQWQRILQLSDGGPAGGASSANTPAASVSVGSASAGGASAGNASASKASAGKGTDKSAKTASSSPAARSDGGSAKAPRASAPSKSAAGGKSTGK